MRVGLPPALGTQAEIAATTFVATSSSSLAMSVLYSTKSRGARIAIERDGIEIFGGSIRFGWRFMVEVNEDDEHQPVNAYNRVVPRP